MALVSAQLQSFYVRLSTTEKPGNAAEAANKIASAYEQYASTGMAGAFPLVSPGPGRAAMAAPLIAAFSMSPGVPATVAAAYAAMLTSFWGAAQFVGPSGPGIAAPPAGVGALIPLITTMLLNTNNTAASYASQMASTLDACTRTVLVTFVLPPPAPPLILPVS